MEEKQQKKEKENMLHGSGRSLLIAVACALLFVCDAQSSFDKISSSLSAGRAKSKCTNAAKKEFAIKFSLQGGMDGKYYCMQGYEQKSRMQYRVACNIWGSLSLEPSIRGNECTKIASCKVSKLDAINEYHNMQPLTTSTVVKSGTALSLKCVSGYTMPQAASTPAAHRSFAGYGEQSSTPSAKCQSTGEWEHSLKTTGNKKCQQTAQCKKDTLVAQASYHNMDVKSNLATESKTNQMAYLHCKNGFESAGSLPSAKCNSVGSWESFASTKSIAKDAKTKLCLAVKKQCTVNGETLAHGAEYRNDCHKCTCNDGKATCPASPCPKCTKDSLKHAANNMILQFESKIVPQSGPGTTVSIRCKQNFSPWSEKGKPFVYLRCAEDTEWKVLDNNDIDDRYASSDPICVAETTCKKTDLTNLLTEESIVAYGMNNVETFKVNSYFKVSCATNTEAPREFFAAGVTCTSDGEWKLSRKEHQDLVDQNGPVCTASKSKCTINGRTFSHGQKMIPQGDKCLGYPLNTCECEDGTATCTTHTCQQCTKSDLTQHMSEKNTVYYSSGYEKYVKDANPPGKTFLLKCEKGFNHQESKTRRSLWTSFFTSIGTFVVKCSNTGTWEETKSNCVGEKKTCTNNGKDYEHGAKITIDCNSCTCNDGTCTMSTNACVKCSNSDLKTIMTKNNLESSYMAPRGTDSPANTKTYFKCQKNYQLSQSFSTNALMSECKASQSGAGAWVSPNVDVQTILANDQTKLCVPEKKCKANDAMTLMATHKIMSIDKLTKNSEYSLNSKARVKCQSGYNHPTGKGKNRGNEKNNVG